MDVRQLETFLAVAAELSFTRGADRLFTAQSAVSATIRGLERELGTALFDRSARQIRLTAAGEALQPCARAVLDAVQAARDAVDTVRGGLTGRVAVGFLTSVTIVDIPAILAEFTRLHPGVSVVLRAAPRGSGGLVDLLRAAELDVAFAALTPSLGPDLHVVELGRSPLRPTVPADHPWAARTSVTLAELAGHGFVDFPEGFGSRTIVDALFASAGLPRRVSFETTDISAARDLVRHGLGVAFLPDFLTTNDPRVHALDLAEGNPDLRIGAVTLRRRTPSAAARALTELAMRWARTKEEDEARTTSSPVIPGAALSPIPARGLA